MKKGGLGTNAYELESYCPYDQMMDQQSVRNMFISYPSQSIMSSHNSDDGSINFRAEPILESEKGERYTTIISCLEGKAKYVVGTSFRKMQIYNETFSTKRSLSLESCLVCGISSHEKIYMALENKSLLQMNSYSQEIKPMGRTSNHVTKMLIYRDKVLLTAQFNGIVEAHDLKRGEVVKSIDFTHFLKVNDIILTAV